MYINGPYVSKNFVNPNLHSKEADKIALVNLPVMPPSYVDHAGSNVESS